MVKDIGVTSTKSKAETAWIARMIEFIALLFLNGRKYSVHGLAIQLRRHLDQNCVGIILPKCLPDRIAETRQVCSVHPLRHRVHGRRHPPIEQVFQEPGADDEQQTCRVSAMRSEEHT